MAVALLPKARAIRSRWLLQGGCDRDAGQDSKLVQQNSLRVVGHGGFVADEELAKKRVEVLLKQLAAVVR
eukprot:2712737-Pleurochrysis_carterae.AAC.1